MSITLYTSSAPPKSSYNKSKKRLVKESTDNTDKSTNSLLKKLNLSITILGLTKEIERARKVKEVYKSS